MIESLRVIVNRWPDRTAVESGGESLNYAALWEAIWSLAANLRRLDPHGGPVGVLLPPGAAYAIGVFGCLAADRICVPLDDAAPHARTADLVAELGIKLVIAPEISTKTRFDGAMTLSEWSSRRGLGFAPSGRRRLGLDNPAFILCTSGSTGRPKPIVHSQRTMLHWARTTHNALHVREEDRVVSLSSLSSLGGFTALLSYPLAGACLQMLDIKSIGLSGLTAELTRRRVTIFRAAPSMLRLLAKLPDAHGVFSTLRIVQGYGEPLTRADVADLRAVIPTDCFIRTTYGSTECSGFSWFARPDDDQHAQHAPAGVLMPDTQAAIIDDGGACVAAGQTGELVIRSRYNALGEWAGGRLVPGRLEADADDPHVRIYRTGDLAHISADGVCVIVGRKDRMLKMNGQRFEPAEVEWVLRQHPAVARCEVVVDLSADTPRLQAFVVPTASPPVDLPAQLKASLRAALPTFMIPTRVSVVSAIPLLASGKVDANALLAAAGSHLPSIHDAVDPNVSVGTGSATAKLSQ